MITFIIFERFGERCHRIVKVSESCFGQTFVHGKNALVFEIRGVLFQLKEGICGALPSIAMI